MANTTPDRLTLLIRNLPPTSEDVFFHEGEAFYIRKATPEDVARVIEPMREANRQAAAEIPADLIDRLYAEGDGKHVEVDEDGRVTNMTLEEWDADLGEGADK